MSAYDDVRAGKDVPLEDLLRDLAARGELTHLSIVAVAGKGPGGVVYSGSFTPAAQFGHGFSRDADPVKAIFEAVEQARIEALGANALGGVRGNLTAVLEASLERKGLNRVGDTAAPPIADILALLVRERLTGDAPPDAAKLLVDRFRGEIEAKAGPDVRTRAQAAARGES